MERLPNSSSIVLHPLELLLRPPIVRGAFGRLGLRWVKIEPGAALDGLERVFEHLLGTTVARQVAGGPAKRAAFTTPCNQTFPNV